MNPPSLRRLGRGCLVLAMLVALTWFRGAPAHAVDEPRRIKVCSGSGVYLHTRWFEPYVKDVLPNEWYTTWRPAALRAGAIAVRTYGWWRVQNPRSASCDIYSTTADQYYIQGSDAASTNTAINDTYGIRIEYLGNRIKALYLSETGNPTGGGSDEFAYTVPTTDSHCPRGIPPAGGGLCTTGTQFYNNGAACDTPGGAAYGTMLNHYYSGITIPTGAWVFLGERFECSGGRYNRIETWQQGNTTNVASRTYYLGAC